MNENASLFFVDKHVDSHIKEKKAFIEYGSNQKFITYADLYEQSSKLRNFFSKFKINREDRVIILMQDVISYPIIFWGCLKSGVVPVLLNTLLSSEVVNDIINNSRAKAVFISSGLLSSFENSVKENVNIKHIIEVGTKKSNYINFDEEIQKCSFKETIKCSKDEIAFWLYSSGSTGQPKGVKHVHGSLEYTYKTYGKQVLKIHQNDIIFSVAKLFFAYGLGNAMTFPMSVGATTILLPERPTPEVVSTLLNKFDVTIFFAVPTIFSAILDFTTSNNFDGFKNLKLSVSAGEALPENIGKKWHELTSTHILDGIGSTEMLHIFLSNKVDDIEYGTTGIAVPGYELKLLDENNNIIENDEIGELLVKGESSADGYWNMRNKSRKTFEGEWTRTGDKYIRNKNGKYVYCGRTDDMFKVSGIWVSPFEVEQAILNHDEVLESAVVPEIDHEGLVKSKAFIILKTEQNQKEKLKEIEKTIKEIVKEKIGLWKYPRSIEFVKTLPKTATGKIQRFKLRK
ncbi:benzoate-CoA ligase family protein [bacterium]|nr:benzoate-CoA ligase family protein [bacterium]